MVEDLLKNGADPNHPTELYGSFLGYATAETEDDRTEYLLAKILLEYGADIFATVYHGEGILHNVAYLNKPDITRLLISFGADVNKADDKGKTPLM